MAVIVTFFVAHWILSVFFQSFFLHRYGAHRMYTLTKGWERFFYFCTYATAGSSFLLPRAYAVLHREHHAFSDTERDPHSPHVYPSLARMMSATLKRYAGIARGTIVPEARFTVGLPEWPALDRFADGWFSRLAWGALYVLVYIRFAPHPVFFLLLPFHFLMGPTHGAIVNWCGHKYGYRNFAGENGDRSRNSLPIDFVTMGELFQNNHHKYGMAPNFAVRWFEIDPTWTVMRVFAAVGIIRLADRPQHVRWAPATTNALPAGVKPSAG